MGGTTDGDSPFATAESLRCSAAQQGQSLKGFESRTHECFMIWLSGSPQHTAAAVADNNMNPVAGFNRRASPQVHFQWRSLRTVRAEPLYPDGSGMKVTMIPLGSESLTDARTTEHQSR